MDAKEELQAAAAALESGEYGVSALSAPTLRAILAAVLRHLAGRRRDRRLAEAVVMLLSSSVSIDVVGLHQEIAGGILPIRSPQHARARAGQFRRGRGQVKPPPEESWRLVDEVRTAERAIRRGARGRASLEECWRQLGQRGRIPGYLIDDVKGRRSPYAAALALVAAAHGVEDIDSLRRRIHRATPR